MSNPAEETKERKSPRPPLTQRKLVKSTDERRSGMMAFQPKPPTWLAHQKHTTPHPHPSLPASHAAPELPSRRQTIVDEETKEVAPLTPHQNARLREEMSPYDDPGQPPPDEEYRQRKIREKIEEKKRLQKQLNDAPKGEEKTRLLGEINRLNAAAETAVEEMKKANNYWDRTGMGKQHPNISFQPFELNISHLQPGQKFHALLPTGREHMPGDKPYVVRTAVSEGHPDFGIGERGERTMRTLLPTQILSGSQTQSYQKLNQHSLNVDDLIPGQKYLIVMNQQASKGFEGGPAGRRYEHETIKIANWPQKCNSMAVGIFQGKSTWDTFVERVNVAGVPARDLGFVGSRAGEKHEEYKKNLETKIIPNIEAEIKTVEGIKWKSKDDEKISQLKKNLVKIKGQLAEAKKIEPWTHYKIKKEKLVEGLKEEGDAGRLKRALENTDGLPPVHITDFHSHRTIPSPHPDNIPPDTKVARFSCIQDIIEPGSPPRSQISEWVRSMKPDYVYFPADGVRQTNGHTEWLFKFYPLSDEIKNIKDRKAAALKFLRTGKRGEKHPRLDPAPSINECGDIELETGLLRDGEGMEGLGMGDVCQQPHLIAGLVASYLGHPVRGGPPRGRPGGGGRKKTRKKTRRKSHKKKRKKTRRRSHKKKRTTRKKKIKRK